MPINRFLIALLIGMLTVARASAADVVPANVSFRNDVMAVLSKAGNPVRSRHAMESVYQRLVKSDKKLVQSKI